MQTGSKACLRRNPGTRGRKGNGKNTALGGKCAIYKLNIFSSFFESFSAHNQVSPPFTSHSAFGPCLPLPCSAKLQSVCFLVCLSLSQCGGPCPVPTLVIFLTSPPVAPPVGAFSTPGPGCWRPVFHLSLSLRHPAQSPSSADFSVEKAQVTERGSGTQSSSVAHGCPRLCAAPLERGPPRRSPNLTEVVPRLVGT